MRITTTFAETRRLGRGSVGLVPTMGYLHEGHLSLLHAARANADTVVMSLFVNPMQFAPEEDLSTYPRDLDRDAALAEAAGVDVVFAPPLAEMYPFPPSTEVVVSGVTDPLEGAHRPGHFAGVALVVAKLLAGIRPDRAFFGRKDAQQLAVVRRLTRDLSLPVEIVGCPIVREQDGLALSSRNTYLSSSEREAALALSRGLMEAAGAVEAGERDAAALGSHVVDAVGQTGGAVDLEYVALADTDDVLVLTMLDRPAFLAVAARVGATRLIDNVHFDPLPDGSYAADRGVRIDEPSVLYSEEG